MPRLTMLLMVAALIMVLQQGSVDCARILCLFPVPSKSHLVVFSEMTRELARRGHELVVASPFPLSKAPTNYTDINTMPSIFEIHQEMMSIDLYSMTEMPTYQIPFLYWYHGFKVMNGTLNDPGVLALLKDKQGFDLVICEDFLSESLYAFADYFKAPLILISSLGGFHWTNYEVGNPLEPTYVPNPMLSYSDRMTLNERLVNTLFAAAWDFGNFVFYLPRQEELRKKVFGAQTRSVWDLRYSASLVLLNSHFSLNHPRPLPPAMIEVGGLHVARSFKKLPEDLQSFLDGATEGAIYFSMGSNLRSDAMPAHRRDAFLQAFAELPQRVIMKWESDSLPGQPKNVKLGKWLPQQDILAHPNVKMFITHGGLLSAQEAIYHGVPLVGIPVFGDQMLNMRKAVFGGYGVLVSLTNATKQSLQWAIEEALHNPSIRREAQRRSAVFRDQLETPLDRAVFWVEHVLRHKGAPHLRSAALDLAWYQLYMLDLAAIVLLTFLVALFISYKLLQRMCSKSNSPKIRKSNKKKRK
ncbi:UDP-glycosyltransferase-05 [Ephemera danica]|nr:UDP-glycosyltransferase-05 [Ephemera danica]